ncbi:hypothetical protein MMC09_001311 [Bachmanniomyces sp. S44760]|nr:hypothetical protein [Bachmanniomyces sp. S44760]
MLDVNLSDLSGHTSMSSESPNEQHLCKWIVNHSTGKQCGLGFKDPNELQIHAHATHVKSQPRDQPLSCGWSGCTTKRKLTDKTILGRHVKMHTGSHYDPTYRCDYCPLKFKKPSGLKRHMMTHVLYKAEVEAEAMILFESTASSSLGN